MSCSIGNSAAWRRGAQKASFPPLLVVFSKWEQWQCSLTIGPLQRERELAWRCCLDDFTGCMTYSLHCLFSCSLLFRELKETKTIYHLFCHPSLIMTAPGEGYCCTLRAPNPQEPEVPVYTPAAAASIYIALWLLSPNTSQKCEHLSHEALFTLL